MESSSLVAAWQSLPDDPAIAYYGGDLMVRGKILDILEYMAFTEQEKLDALNHIVLNKHALVLALSTTGVCPIIDSEIRPLFDEIVTLLQDSNPGIAAKALENLQDMVLYQTLREISKEHVNISFCTWMNS